MRIITFNLNGIRSAAKKGFYEWLPKQHADIICMQEVKAQMEKLEGEIYRPKGYLSYFADAKKPGYSGVGIYCKKKPDKVIKELDWKCCDEEGRYLEIQYGKLSIISLYIPSGSSGEIRQKIKFEFMGHLLTYLKKLRRRKRHYIICGDWNIAHRTIDVKNWRPNQKISGFLPEERVWLECVLTDHDWIDAFRLLNSEPDQYTFWSTRGEAYAKNVGWRIDYQMTTPEIKNKIKAVSIYKGKKFSDHAPLIVDYEDEI